MLIQKSDLILIKFILCFIKILLLVRVRISSMSMELDIIWEMVGKKERNNKKRDREIEREGGRRRK